MTQDTSVGMFRELGLTRIINAQGTATAFGGSILSPKIQAAAEQANET